jgi:hypothetical protein
VRPEPLTISAERALRSASSSTGTCGHKAGSRQLTLCLLGGHLLEVAPHEDVSVNGNDIRRSTVEYRHLGRAGLQVSRLGGGTMNFGMTADEAAGSEIMDEALESGINYLDTADVYRGALSHRT